MPTFTLEEITHIVGGMLTKVEDAKNFSNCTTFVI